MSAMHHKQIEDSDVCVYCLEDWPCEVAKIRRELAEHIRGLHVAETGHPSFEDGKEAGLDLAADTIDIEGN